MSSTLASEFEGPLLCLLSVGTAGAWLLWVGSGNSTQDLMTSEPILNHSPSPPYILTVAKCKWYKDCILYKTSGLNAENYKILNLLSQPFVSMALNASILHPQTTHLLFCPRVS